MMTLPLATVLERFRDQINEHPRLRGLLKGWDRRILVQASDTTERFKLTFRATKIEEIACAEEGDDSDPEITLRAPARILNEVFSGARNPATLFLAGELQVFASESDQVKLDAITLVLWD